MTRQKLIGSIAAVAFGALATAALAFAPAQRGSGKLVFATGDGVSDKLEIAVVRPDGTGFRKLTHLRGPGVVPRWTTSGREILFRTDDGLTGRSANWRMRPDGRRRQRLPGGEWEPPSPNGKLVQVGLNRIVDAKGKTLRRLRLGFRKGDAHGDEPLWSPDGRYLAISVATDTNNVPGSRIHVVATDGRSIGRALMPQNGPDGYVLSWSPDSRRLLVSLPGGWYTISRDGSDRRRLISVRGGDLPHAWAPDSRRIAYVGKHGGLFVVRASGGRPRRLVGTHRHGKTAREVSVDWSSRGELAFSDAGGIFAVRSDGRGLRRITRKRGRPDWSPDGKRLVFEEMHEIFVVGRRGAGLRQLTRWIWDDTPQWSPDGKRIAFVRGARTFARPACCGPPESTRVYVMGANRRGFRHIGRGYGPRWSPDGHGLVFVDFVGSSGPPSMGGLRAGRIVTADVDGSGTREIARGTAPAWAPEGGRIAFMRYSFGPEGRDWGVRDSILLTTRADGSGVREVLRASAVTSEEGIDELYRPQWSPDGRTIALQADDGLRLVDVGTGTVGEPLIDAQTRAFEWSPDGNRIAYAEYDAVGVVVVRTGTKRTLARSRGEHSSPSWSPDGTHIAYIRCTPPDGAACGVYAVNADGSPPRRLSKTGGVETAVDWGA
jgi:Tol biopolymer transport system component